jgi:hypothetical protein
MVEVWPPRFATVASAGCEDDEARYHLAGGTLAISAAVMHLRSDSREGGAKAAAFVHVASSDGTNAAIAPASHPYKFFAAKLLFFIDEILQKAFQAATDPSTASKADRMFQVLQSSPDDYETGRLQFNKLPAFLVQKVIVRREVKASQFRHVAPPDLATSEQVLPPAKKTKKTVRNPFGTRAEAHRFALPGMISSSCSDNKEACPKMSNRTICLKYHVQGECVEDCDRKASHVPLTSHQLDKQSRDFVRKVTGKDE